MELVGVLKEEESREKIIAFKKGMVDIGMSCKAKVMKLGDNDKLDKAVFIWFEWKVFQLVQCYVKKVHT